MAKRLNPELLNKDKIVDVVCGPDAYKHLPRLLAVTRSRQTAGKQDLIPPFKHSPHTPPSPSIIFVVTALASRIDIGVTLQCCLCRRWRLSHCCQQCLPTVFSSISQRLSDLL